MPTLPFLHPGFYQICYVTNDLDAGIRQLAAPHGIERFRVKRDVRSPPGMPAMMMHQAHVFLVASRRWWPKTWCARCKKGRTSASPAARRRWFTTSSGFRCDWCAR